MEQQQTIFSTKLNFRAIGFILFLMLITGTLLGLWFTSKDIAASTEGANGIQDLTFWICIGGAIVLFFSIFIKTSQKPKYL